MANNISNTTKFIREQIAPTDYYELAAQAQTQLIELISNVEDEVPTNNLVGFFRYSLDLMRAVVKDQSPGDSA